MCVSNIAPTSPSNSYFKAEVDELNSTLYEEVLKLCGQSSYSMLILKSKYVNVGMDTKQTCVFKRLDYVLQICWS